MNEDKESGWLAAHPEEEAKYKGEYIAVVEEKIVAHGSDFIKVIEEAKVYSDDPLFAKVPQWEVMAV
ncbi:hypothetical protein KKG61_04325 [bacterium]|nr:hypothetical protein [bacterium]MBU1599315.1 hypothetical protein [bacterium]